MPGIDTWLRSLARGEDDRTAAIQASAREDARVRQGATLEYESLVRPFCEARNGLLLGTTWSPGGAREVRLAPRIAYGTSGWAVGSTGVGKTSAMAAWACQDLAERDVVPIFIDHKGDLVTQILTTILPYLITRLPASRAAAILAGLRIWAPWSSPYIPSLCLTAPGGSPARRAVALTELFVATVGAGELGHRQQAVFTPTLRLLMATGTPLPLLQDVLVSDRFRLALLGLARDPELESYFRDRFATDAREGVTYSILSRFDRFVSDEVTKLALFGDEPFEPATWLEEGVTLCNLGGGLDTHRRFWASLVQHEIVKAILRRQVTRGSPRVVVRIDEVQVGLAGVDQARELENALSLMRSRRAALWVAHQHAGQLAEYPNLLQSLRTNTGVQVVFRVPRETVSATACVLPESLPPPLTGPAPSERQIRDAWEVAVGALPNRTFLLRVPTLAPSAIPVRATDLDLRQSTDGLPSEVREVLARGRGSYSRAELMNRERAWRALASELSQADTPNCDALARLVESGQSNRPARRRTRVETG